MKNFNYIRTYEWGLLLLAICITVLYCVFATPFYEWLYPGTAEYGNMMYNSNMYLIVAILSTIIVWVLALSFYVFIDRAWHRRFIAWLITLLIVILLTPSVGVIYASSELEDMLSPILENDLRNFGFINIAVCAVYYFVVSLCVKGLSKNCATTPF